LAARIGAFEASLCHAKITPAALHRGDFDCPCREGVEALGPRAKFELNDFWRMVAGAASPALQWSCWRQVGQSVPDA
jgi:hypothetical protein